MRVWSVIAARAPATLAGAATTVGSALMIVISPVAGYAEPAGWQPSFAADFSHPDLPAGCWPEDGPATAPTIGYRRPAEVNVSGGMLHLLLDRSRQAGRPYLSGSLACPGTAVAYGRYEFRAKIANRPGVISSVLLRPVDSDEPGDVTEIAIELQPGNGTQPGTEVLSVANGSAVQQARVAAAAPDAFRGYVVEARPGSLTVSVDGRVVVSDQHSSGKPRMIAFAVGTREVHPDLARDRTAPLAEFAVDWVRAMAYDPGYGRPATVLAGIGTRRGGPVPRWLAPVAGCLAVVALFIWYGQTRRPRRWPPPAHRG